MVLGAAMLLDVSPLDVSALDASPLETSTTGGEAGVSVSVIVIDSIVTGSNGGTPLPSITTRPVRMACPTVVCSRARRSNVVEFR